jgi:hypothetical protein
MPSPDASKKNLERAREALKAKLDKIKPKEEDDGVIDVSDSDDEDKKEVVKKSKKSKTPKKPAKKPEPGSDSSGSESGSDSEEEEQPKKKSRKHVDSDKIKSLVDERVNQKLMAQSTSQSLQDLARKFLPGVKL